MRLKRGVSYHPYEYDEKVYVHSVDEQRDYSLEGIALDVLKFFSAHDNATEEKLCAALSKEYAIDDAAEFRNDIREFVDELLAEKILSESATEPEETETQTDYLTGEVERSFAREGKLYSLTFELTYRCVEKCIHCYIDDATNCTKDVELTTEECMGILRQARELGCVEILFTGGEVLLRPDLCDIVECAVGLGLIINVYTTGMGLTDEKFERLCEAKVNSVSFSLYSGIATEHDKITGVQGSFDKTLKAALMFKSAGINTFIKCVAMRQNFDTLESLYKLCKRLKIRLSVSAQIASGHKHKAACDFRLNEEQYKKFFELDSRYRQEKYERYSSEQIDEIRNSPTCNAGITALSVDPYGGVHPCLAFTQAFGSLKINTLKELWSNKTTGLSYLKNFKLLNLTGHCRSCEVTEYCHVCIGDLFKEQAGELNDCGDTLVMARARAAVVKYLR